MSKLVTDKNVLEGRRKNKLQNVEVPLRDQIVDKLITKLEEMRFGEKISNLWHDENANRQVWLERQQVYLANWDEFNLSSAEGPFEDSSSLHLPVAFTVVKTYHARMLQTIVGVDPPFNVKARRADSTERTQLIEDLMSYALSEWINDRQGIDLVLDTFIWDWITTGVGIAKISWDVKYQKFIDVEEVPEEGPPRFVIDEEGNERSFPTIQMKEQEVERVIEKFRGPRLDHIRAEDLIIVGGDGDPDQADVVLHRQYVTASELWTLSDRKIFREDAVRKTIHSGPDSRESGISNNIKLQRSQDAGFSQLDNDNDLDRYEIYEAYASADVDGSGINSEIIVWVHAKTREILRATYLNRVNKAGDRPFAKIDFHKRPGEVYGMGLIEILHPLTTEMDAMHNMRIDFGMLSTMPYGFYRPSSSIEPEEIELRPGALIPVDNPQTDVFFPNLGNRTVFGFQEEAALQTMIERLTGISDLSLGVLSSQQGATRTATGARALIGEASANLDVHLRRLNVGWKKILETILHTLQQRMPQGFSFRVTGQDGADYFAQIKDREQIMGDFDFDLSSNTSNSNKAIQQQAAQQIQTITNNPLNLQLGVVTAGNIFESTKNLLQSLGVKDWSRFITKPAEVTFIMAPDEELARVIRGIPVKVVPQMDHQGYIDYWEQIKASDELLGQFNEEQTAFAEAQAISHRQIMQAMEAAAAQQRNVQQMQINAQASSLQNPELIGVS